MKCFQCKRKIPLVDEQLCLCNGCKEHFCINHRGNHFLTCTLFFMKKKLEEQELLKRKIMEEATSKPKVPVF